MGRTPAVTNNMNDKKFELMGQILSIISNANDLAAMLEKNMNDDPKDEYTLDAVSLTVITSQLRLTGSLAKNLFEENQTIADNFVALLKKHGIPTPDHL